MPNLNNAIYERISEYLGIMDEDELRELAAICTVMANTKEDEHRERLRDSLTENFQKALNDILQSGFSLSLKNIYRDSDNGGYVVFFPDDKFCITLK